ncbi:substrate-binding periplasmic protein [Pseudoduganella namucuonensis]|uniref:Amino acid ABC transporter substrate-binding protein, PAAT family n=1 Tax=Pseudoduganella namucuonensis TaxID=1035707 RepID=A0A1I7I9M7_9BURK|nr:transporter substrate-binding domain-containing protein [Pseudoduganella namucuonensis]SFU69685.1 amino acid ABC transporter substrate-binding protein, PAAT family [Pseudoduganella namucuonensis]
MKRSCHLLLSTVFGVLGALPCCARAAPLIVLADTGAQMPLAEARDGRVVAGMHYDLGQALAKLLGRTAVFRSLPRKRIAQALEQGQGDIVCLYMAPWLPGKLHWTQHFFPYSEVVVTSRGVERPRALADLADQQIGTVLGYVYPDLEQALGERFRRADAVSGWNNLRKLSLGRVRHVSTLTLFVDYYRKQGGKLDIHPPLLVRTYLTQCAVSPRSGVSVDEVNRAIDKLLHDGELNKIMAHYR